MGPAFAAFALAAGTVFPPCVLLPPQMSKPVEKAGLEGQGAALHRIRITLTSKNVKNLEKGELGRWGNRPVQTTPHA